MTKAILVVEQDRVDRDRVGAWLEQAGFEVLACPGPTEPDYLCVGSIGRSCPLVDGADAVVLDVWLAGDSAVAGTSGVELLDFYLGTGKPVLALRHGADATHEFLAEDLAVIDWPADRREVVETVLALVR